MIALLATEQSEQRDASDLGNLRQKARERSARKNNKLSATQVRENAHANRSK